MNVRGIIGKDEKAMKYVRKNTAFMSFTTFTDEDLPTELEIHRWMKQKGLRKEYVEGIDASGLKFKKPILLKFTYCEELEKFLEQRRKGMLPFATTSGEVKYVIIENCEDRPSYVKIEGVPFEMEGSTVQKELTGYGTVLQCKRDVYQGGEYIEMSKTRFTAKMKITMNIPSFVFVDELRLRL
jgi:hypothetical protein